MRRGTSSLGDLYVGRLFEPTLARYGPGGAESEAFPLGLRGLMSHDAVRSFKESARDAVRTPELRKITADGDEDRETVDSQHERSGAFVHWQVRSFDLGQVSRSRAR